MNSEIEVIEIENPISLKEDLENLVNEGWEIKGVVGYNPHNPNSKPFVILERQKTEKTPVDTGYQGDEERFYTKPEPPRQEISLSVGD